MRWHSGRAPEPHHGAANGTTLGKPRRPRGRRARAASAAQREAAPVMPSDFGDLHPALLRSLMPLLPQSDPTTPLGAPRLPRAESYSQRLAAGAGGQGQEPPPRPPPPRPPPLRPLHVGFISSDFGVHPVSSLVRGLIQDLVGGGAGRRGPARGSGAARVGPRPETRPWPRPGSAGAAVEVSCWVLTDEDSWWRRNVSSLLPRHRFVNLHGVPHREARPPATLV